MCSNTLGLSPCVFDWPVSTCDIFNRLTRDASKEGGCFIIWKMTAVGICIFGLCYKFDITMVTMFILTPISAIMPSTQDFLSMHGFTQTNPYIPSSKGWKIFTHFVYKITNNWPQIFCFEAIMMTLVILRNFRILGVGVTIMGISENVSIEMYLEHLLHSV